MRLQLFGLALILSACGTPGAPAASSLATASNPASPASLPAAVVALITPTAQALPISPQRSDCQNNALFVEDLSVPDGTQVAGGEQIQKRWTVSNAGSCDWTAEYLLVRTDDSLIGGPGELALFPARAGEQAVWEVTIVAPFEQGEYRASWQAQGPDGTLFGDPVFVLIEVVGPEQP